MDIPILKDFNEYSKEEKELIMKGAENILKKMENILG